MLLISICLLMCSAVQFMANSKHTPSGREGLAQISNLLQTVINYVLLTD